MALSICDIHAAMVSMATLLAVMHAPVNLTEHSNKGGEIASQVNEPEGLLRYMQ
ncbi:hypothetical protein LF25067_01362 [Limosilactobacillus fermentum]|nr:hypothetical protein LF25067_01362 [Limosilactobacillus fermentum]